MSVGKKISIVISCLAIVLAGVLLYMYYPAILGTINGSKYYSAIDVQNSYNKGYDDGNIAGNEISEKLTYYSTLIGEYEEDIRFLNTEITNLNEMNKTNEVKVAELTALKNANLETISNLHTTIDENEATINDLNSEISGLNTEIDNLNTTITNHQLTIERKNSEIDSLNAEIDDLNNQIAELTASGEDKDDEIANLQSQIEVLEGTIVTKNAEIESLNTEILELESTNEGLNAEIDELNNTISNLTGENNEHLTTIGSLKEQIGALNSRINTLTSELTSAQNEIQELNNRIVGLQQTIEDYEEYIATLEASANLVVAIFEFDNKVYSIESVGDNHLVHVDNPVSTDNVIFNYWMVNGERVDLAVYEVMTTTKFIANVTYKHNVTFEVDGEVYATQLVEKNTCVPIIQEPIKEKYTFNGWSIDGYNVVDVYNQPITTDITFKAIFTSTYGLFNTDTGENIYTWDELIDYEYLALEGTTLSAGENYLRLSGDLYVDNDVIDIADNTFNSCSGLVSVILPEGLKTIGKRAFSSCSSLDTIVIPSSLTTIGQEAFFSLRGMNVRCVDYLGDIAGWCNISFYDYTSNPTYWAKGIYLNGSKLEGVVTIPNSVTSIGQCAFVGFENEFTLSANLQSIGKYGFYNSTLSSISFPNSLETIGDNCFAYCKSLTNILMSSNLQELPYRSFEQCVSLKELNFNNVASIGEEAFRDSGIERVVLTSNLTYLGPKSFYRCKSLSYVYFDTIEDKSSRNNCAFSEAGDNVTGFDFVIGDNARILDRWLVGNSLLKSITIGKNVEQIPYYSFYYSDCLEFNYYATNCVLESKDGKTAISDMSEDYTKYPSTLFIGANVQTISPHAFRYMSSVHLITFEEGCKLTTISNYSFQGFSKVTEIIGFPSTITSIGDYGLYGLSSISNFVIPNGVTSIGMNALGMCNGLTSVNLPNLEIIGDNAFINCTNLTYVNISSSITSLGKSSFSGCTSLELAEISTNINSTDYPFYNVGSEMTKTDFLIKEGVTEISKLVNSNYIGDISLPTTLTKLGSNVCIRGIAENLYFNCANFERLNRAFQYLNTASTNEGFNVYVGENVEVLETDLFMDCKVKNVSFAENSKLKTIGLGTFARTNITSIVIPSSVERIGITCFEECKNLTSIYISFTSGSIAPSSTSSSTLCELANPNLVIYLAGSEENYTLGSKWNVYSYTTAEGYTYYDVVFNCSYDDYLNAITSTEV